MTSRPEHVIAKELEAMKKPNWREIFEAQFKWGKWPKGHPLEGQRVRIRKSNGEPVGRQQYRKEYFEAKNAQGLKIRKGEHVGDPGLRIAGPGSGKGQVKFARDKNGKLIPHPVHGRPMTVEEAKEFADYEAKKNPPKPVAGKDGVIEGTAADGSKVKIFPGNPYYNKVIKNPNFRIPVEETTAIKSSNLPTTEQQVNQLPKTTKEYSSRHERNQVKSLTIPAKNDNSVSVVEESGAVTRYAPKYKQVGDLMINPGGLVGRNADVRRSDGRSTSLSIAQRDWKGIKKGEMLGVLTSNQRDLYDRDVLGIG